MSTRATYKFFTSPSSQPITVYIHSDGYALGAAAYLANAVIYAQTYSSHNNGLLEGFIRGNTNAEIAHPNHGDLEYRYTITPRELNTNTDPNSPIHIQVEQRVKVGGQKFRTVHFGPLADFLNTWRDEALADHGQEELKGSWLKHLVRGRFYDELWPDGERRIVQRGEKANADDELSAMGEDIARDLTRAGLKLV